MLERFLNIFRGEKVIKVEHEYDAYASRIPLIAYLQRLIKEIETDEIEFTKIEEREVTTSGVNIDDSGKEFLTNNPTGEKVLLVRWKKKERNQNYSRSLHTQAVRERMLENDRK